MSVDTLCSICLDSFNEIKRLAITLDCGHKYCRKCISAYAKIKAKEQVPEFTCPDCRTPFSPERLVAKKDLTIWKKKKRALGKIMCPRDGCSGQILGQTCLKCRHFVCTLCLEPEHNGGCKEGLVANLRYKIKNTKQCPQCGVSIEKDGGCNHMHCNVCGKDFGWHEADKITVRPIIPTRPRLEKDEKPHRCIKCARYCITVEALCCPCFLRTQDVDYELCSYCRF